MMAAVPARGRSICEIKQALANPRAEAKGSEEAPDRKKRIQSRRREVCLDVAQYLAEWIPGEKGCQEAWLEGNDLTGEELQEERPVPFSTTFGDSPDRVRRAMESSSRFYGEWKLKSWVQDMNDEHGIAPPVQRVYEEFQWKLAGQKHNGAAVN